MLFSLSFLSKDYLFNEIIVPDFRKANVISETPSADHVEQSVEVSDSVTDNLIGALANFNIEDCQFVYF